MVDARVLKAIIFDMDGVLVETNERNSKLFNEVFGELGLLVTEKNISSCLGRSLNDIIEFLKQDCGVTQNIDSEFLIAKLREKQLFWIDKEIKPNKLIFNFISNAKSEGIKIGVATSSWGPRANKILQNLGIFDLLDTLVTKEDVENHKPAPDVFLKAADNLDVEAVSCVVIEDAVNGINAAKSAGMKAVAKMTSVNKREQFVDLADSIVDSFSDLTLNDLNKLFVD